MFTFDACTIHPQGLNTPFLLAEHLPTFGYELLAYNLLLLFVETQQGNVLLAQVPHDSCVRACLPQLPGGVVVVVQLENKRDWSNALVLRLFHCLQYILLLQSHKNWGCESLGMRLHLIGQMSHACYRNVIGQRSYDVL